MKRHILFIMIVCLFQSLCMTAQQLDPPDAPPPPMEFSIPDDPDQPYNWVEQMPEYPEGTRAMYTFLSSCIKEKYTDTIVAAGTEIVQFVVERDGSIQHIKSMRSVDHKRFEALLACLQEMPKWKPGQHMGAPVRVVYTLPVRFENQ